MDHEQIYAKTASGERAMLERTRNMPRNVRMVLILVDSRSSVGDLCLKTGNPQMTESALRELEMGGFIEPRRPRDSLWDEEEKLANEIRASANNKKLKAKAAHSAQGEPASSAATPATTAIDAAAMAQAADLGTAALPPEEAAPAIASLPAATQLQADVPLAVESPTSIGQRFKAFFSRPPVMDSASAGGERTDVAIPGEPSASAAPTGGQRGRRRRALGWPAIVALALVIVVAALALGVALFPYARYLPELEAAMTRATGRPVRIASLRVDLYPKPVLRLGDVRIGEDGGGVALRVAVLRLAATPGSLLAGARDFDSVVASGVAVSAETLAGLPSLFSNLAKSSVRATARRLDLEDAAISLGGFEFPKMNGTLSLSDTGQFVALRVASTDNTLALALTPQLEGEKVISLGVALEAIGWRPVPESPFLVDTASLEGAYANGVLSISHSEIRLFDGVISGSAVLGRDKAERISGEMTAKHLNAARLSEALGFAQQLVGDLDGALRFAATIEASATLASSLDADGEFSIGRGSVRGLDLNEAARRMSRVPVLGGETKFESLQGKLRLTPTSWRVSELVLTSGVMQSTGSIDVGKDLALSGNLELRTLGTVNQTRVPLLVGGTLRAPSVQSGRNP